MHFHLFEIITALCILLNSWVAYKCVKQYNTLGYYANGFAVGYNVAILILSLAGIVS